MFSPPGLEEPTGTGTAIAARILTEPVRLRTWRETAHNVLAFPLGLLWFVVFLPLLALGVGLIPLALAGLVVLFIAFVLAQAAAAAERELASALLEVHTEPPVRRSPNGSGPWAHFWARLIDPVTWKELIYLFLSFPLGLASFIGAVLVWWTAIGGITFPLWGWLAVEGNSDDTVVLWAGGPRPSIGEYAANFSTGVAALFLAPWIMRAFALLREAMVRVLLGRSREQELEHEVDRLADSRARSVDAASSDRVRIERDLHDGAQARLVHLAMDLGRARDRLERQGDAGEAATLVAEAHEEAKRALAELRDLARGIHPSVLTDRGLDAALSSLAARSPVPVTLDVDLRERPSPRVEAVAYFVLAELLTNVARHSRASGVRVRVARLGDRLVLEVRDDGVGGADPALGTGLAGLVDRVQTLDGSLDIHSPVGGPTSARVELPFV
ncbi:MAG TPA: sensor domain-containing protein [Acidimicrobiales bacterium]|nr:sensor domain-containing protein [Acidimicrobiales bacterium]